MNVPTIRELECFLAVAEELSFTRAAEQLGLAQPPLSRHVRGLEEKLGVRLFERSRKRVALTAAGRAFLRDTRGLLPALQQAAENARRSASGQTERLEIGFVSAVFSPELSEVFARFRANHPEIELRLHDHLPSRQLELISQGRLDLGFVGVPPRKPGLGIELQPWRRECLMAFLPPGHHLSEEAKVSLRDLAAEPFISVSSEAAPAFSEAVREWCRKAGFRPRVVQEADRAQAVAAMTIAGSGVALLPESLHRITGNGVSLKRIKGAIPAIEHAVAYSADPDSAVRTFLSEL